MTAERRLAAVATKLTPLERARLVLRADFAGETLDANLLRVLEPEKVVCRRIVDAANSLDLPGRLVSDGDPARLAVLSGR